LIHKYFRNPSPVDIDPIKNCRNCNNIIKSAKIKRNFIQNPPILML